MRRFPLLAGLGAAGIAGIVLLLGSLVFTLAATLPLRAERDRLDGERQRLAAAAVPGGQAQAAAPVHLPPLAQAPEVLKQLNALAQKDAVAITRSTYQVKTEDARRVYQVDLPLKASYPTLRTYLRDVLASNPTVRLDDLNLHRATASDPNVDADVRLSFSFAAGS